MKAQFGGGAGVHNQGGKLVGQGTEHPPVFRAVVQFEGSNLDESGGDGRLFPVLFPPFYDF